MELLGIIGPWQILIVFVALISLLLPLIALIDILRNEYTGSNKLIWVLVVLLFPFLGPVLYFIMGTQQKIKKN